VVVSSGGVLFFQAPNGVLQVRREFLFGSCEVPCICVRPSLPPGALYWHLAVSL
jgi:hypothetical protein